jgi:hypothetical protein
VKFTLKQAIKARGVGGSRGIAPLFLQPSALDWGWVVNATPRPLYSRDGDRVPIVQEAQCAPGPVWTSAENLAPTGIRSPDRPARNDYAILARNEISKS